MMDNATLSVRLVDRSSVHTCKRRTQRNSTILSKAAMASGLFALLACVPAWSTTETSRDVIVLWSGDDQWVKIEQQDSGAAPNDHPAQLGAEAVANALAALRVRVVDGDSGAETQRPVFTRAEIENLTPQVVAGLSKAGPRQDVTFSTIGSHALSAGGLLKDPGVNAGRIFYQGGKLNVIFGELQSNYRKKNIYGQRNEDFTPRRQGSRDKASKQKFSLAMSPGIELHAASGGAIRNDWVVIDPAVAGSQAVATPEPGAAEPRQAAAAPAATSPAPASASPATASPSAAPPPTSSGAVPAAEAAQGPAAASAASASKTGKPAAEIEQRLQKLKDLRDKGLISEEAYNSRVKELLSEL